MKKEMLKEMLPYATGELELTDKILKSLEGDSERIIALNTLGLIAWNKKEGDIRVRQNCRNMANGTPKMKDFVQKFTDCDISVDFRDISRNMPAGLFSLEKIAGDVDASIIDMTSGRVIASLKFMKDTRCPWVDIEGDERDYDLNLTLFTYPNSNGFMSRYDGWEKNGSKFTYDGHGLNEFLGCIVYTLQIIGAKKMDVEVEKVEYTFLQRKQFIASAMFCGSYDGIEVEITKNAGQQVGKVIFDENDIGEVELVHSGSNYRCNVTVKSVPECTTKNRIINAVNAAVLNPVG